MYPYPLFFGLGFYELFLLLGILAAFLMLRRLTGRMGLSAALHNLILTSAVVGIIGGYFCAVLMQGVYDALATGVFALNRNTGATFLGGMCGGVALFLILYLAGGRLFLPNEQPLRHFSDAADCLGVCIPLAHGFGRIGCLMAGCCYGKPADWGVYLPEEGLRVVPVPLFESAVLFAIAAFLYRRIAKKPGSGLRGYLLLYGTARFFLEFLRDDDRGATVVPFLSPSQFTCVILVLLALALIVLSGIRERKRRSS